MKGVRHKRDIIPQASNTKRGVAISGKAGAGKNAFALEIQRVLATRGVRAVQVSLAAAVKADVKRLYCLEKGDIGARKKLIEHGYGMRAVCADYWIRRLAKQTDSLTLYGVIPLVVDVRYENEIEWAQASDFLCVRVDATAMDRGYALYRQGEEIEFAVSDHPSEVELDDWDFDLRFWNPHGDNGSALSHYAVRVADLLLEQESRLEA